MLKVYSCTKNDEVWGEMKIPKDRLKRGGQNSTPKKPKYAIK